MSRFIPNERSKVYFLTSAPTAADSVTTAELTAGKDLTPFIISVNASSQGNTVPTPNISTLFETSIPGTVQAAFSADMYRDDEDDDAWDALPRGTEGVFVISRVGGSGTDGELDTGDKVELWPVMVVSRTMSNMSSNTAATFTIQGSIPREPVENATVGS